MVGWSAGRGGFITRPTFNGKEVPENRCALTDRFLHISQGGLQTRPYPDDNTHIDDNAGETLSYQDNPRLTKPRHFKV